ncbi:GNAT family N-acetyltransferase [Pedobacter sp. Du54]|uniref:GNAT family N-acetyltransferase n=1 Tax=Pedobacter anseongensis TaxID=3133439 RepID=UPI0030A7EDF0
MHLEYLNLEHKEQFLDLINDEDIKYYISAFNDEEETIIEKLRDINQDKSVGTAYAIIDNGKLVGYLSSKRSVHLYHKIYSHVEILHEEPYAELLQKSPFIIDIAIHREFRERGLAKAAIALILEKHRSLGNVEAVYFEINTKNAQSIKLVKGLGGEWIYDYDYFEDFVSIYEFRFF